MKQFLFFIAFCTQGSVFSQVYNEYSTMPRTININIVQPMKPVKPVDYGALTSNLANDLNNISESRAAQKKAFDDMTSRAIRDVQNNKSLGYSSSLNDQMNAVQQDAVKNIKSYYSVLTNGIIDPADYSNYLTAVVNDYFSFAQSMNELNDKLKSTIDGMKSMNKFGLIETLSTIIDDNAKNTTIAYTSKQREKNRRYNYYFNLGFEFEQKGMSKSKSEYFRSFNSLLSDVNRINPNPNNSTLQNELDVDLVLYENHIYSEISFDTPSTFKQSAESSNSWTKKYSDGTSVLITITLDISAYKELGNSSNEAVEKIRKANNTNNTTPRMLIDYDRNMVLTFVDNDGPAGIAGLKVGDKLLYINNLKMDTDSMVLVAKQGKQVGDTLSLVVDRNGETKKFNLILKNDESCFTSFDIQINNLSGYLFAKSIKKSEYGEETKQLIVNSIAPAGNNFFISSFVITPSKELLSKSNLEIFNIFKPLIRSINDRVVFK
jgi:hypothetical protein